MENLLPDGLPKTRDYLSLINRKEYKELDRYAAQFSTEYEAILTNYAKQWVKNPFRQWSRQWEYPYVFSKVQMSIGNKVDAKILDAGSGVTFFPYFIKTKLPLVEINCIDQNKNLAAVYEEINNSNKNVVAFTSGDLRKLPYANETFDIVYCISVLEHTKSYAEILNEFYRILRPEGKLIVTFDLSLDGTRDISVDECIYLMEILIRKFEFGGKFSDLKHQLQQADIFTTLTAKVIDPNLLPWRYPAFVYQIKAILDRKKFNSWPPQLTVFCATAIRRLE